MESIWKIKRWEQIEQPPIRGFGWQRRGLKDLIYEGEVDGMQRKIEEESF